MSEFVYQCTACGSTNIFNIHYHLWEVSNQEWVVDSEDLICTECGSDDIIMTDINEKLDITKPIIQYGLHLIDVYFPAEYLQKRYNVDAMGLTIVFEKDTLALYKLLINDDLDQNIVNHLFFDALTLLTSKGITDA